jgi:hypothetical protein
VRPDLIGTSLICKPRRHEAASMTAPITEFTGSETNDPQITGRDGARRRNVVVLVIAGLAVMAILVVGSIFLFDPLASAAGSCGGG